MNATVIKHVTPDAEYRNLVVHQCSCTEFVMDILREIEEFTKDKHVGKIDIFWHLGEYCDKKYGRCPWQTVTVGTLMLGAH